MNDLNEVAVLQNTIKKLNDEIAMLRDTNQKQRATLTEFEYCRDHAVTFLKRTSKLHKTLIALNTCGDEITQLISNLSRKA